MERLSVKLRAAVGKMSDERLRLRLVQAGYQADDVGRLDRHGLMQTYAACLADEEEERRAQAAVAEAEGADLFAEAAAAVCGDQEVMGEVPEQQLAGDDQTVGDAQQDEEEGSPAGRGSPGCCHVCRGKAFTFGGEASLDGRTALEGRVGGKREV